MGYLAGAFAHMLRARSPVLIVQRLDRRRAADSVQRIHLIDARQALGMPADTKYERQATSAILTIGEMFLPIQENENSGGHCVGALEALHGHGERGNRFQLHLVHHVVPMHLDGAFCDTQVICNGLVQLPQGDFGHDLFLA